jgi:hypothetical protein
MTTQTQTTNQAALSNGQADEAPVVWGPYATAEEARQQPVDRNGWALYRAVAPDGTVAFAWGRGIDHTIAELARKAGWTASAAGKPPSKAKVADLLAQLSEADRKALLAQYAGKKGK